MQESLDQILALFGDFSLSVADVWPIYLAFQNVFEHLLRRIASEWSNTDNHFISDDSD